MSDDNNAMQLLESNNASKPTMKKKLVEKRLLWKLYCAALLIIIIIIIIILVHSLTKKCKDNILIEKKVKEESKRKDNPYWNESRLPNFVLPEDYIITLQLLKNALNLEEHNIFNTFHGNVIINFMMKESSKFIVLNTKLLEIQYFILKQVSKNENRKSFYVTETLTDELYDQSIIVFSDTLEKSLNFSLEISYKGKLTLSESGIIQTFYRSFSLNKTYGILYSKLEPIGARRMFPCFDEPHRKALYVLKIIHYSKYTALSNMPLLKSVQIDKNSLIFPDNDISKTLSITLSTFNSTFIYMSTYLVAFVLVEDYEQIQQNRKPNFNVAIWGPKGFKPSAKMSLSYAISSENFLELYLNFNSPFLKTDHIYIPNFLSGAMENWGLITYREGHLLMPPRQSEQQSKKAYMTIAHELAHIWFGNWVTVRTWNDLWLNEGFATYFASLAYYKQLNGTEDKTRENFVLQYRQILEKDGKSKSYPVRLKVIKFSDIFNSFTYNKGEALLVWLNAIMGEQKFRAGIQSYIKKYSQKNPTTKDFFKEMQMQMFHSKGFNMSLYEFFDSWLNKIGYPVLTVNYDVLNKRVILSQQSIVLNSSKNDVWPIYTSFKTNLLNTDNPILFKGKYHTINITLGENDFIILNNDASSYIRVNYSTLLWGKIINNIRENNGNINPINKIILFDDNFFFAYSGLINVSITKDLMDTLVNETNSVLWSLFYNKIFTKIYYLFMDDKRFLKWRNYVKYISAKALAKALQINADEKLDEEVETFQKQIFILHCEIDNQEILDYFSKRFNEWIKSPRNNTLPRHLVTCILYYGMRENDKEEYWKIMWKMMMENNDSSSINKDQIAIGLAGTSRPYRLKKLLNYILTLDTHNSNVDKLTFISNLASWILSSNNGINVFSQWMMKKSFEIKKYAFGDNVSRKLAQGHFDGLLGKIASLVYDINVVQALSTLHSKKDVLGKIAASNNKWRENVGMRFFEYL